MLEKLFVDEPSLTEIAICSQCNTTEKKTFPVVKISYDTFNNNISNLENAIVDNFPSKICLECQNAVAYSREYGQHIFVEISSGSYTENTTDFEPRMKHKFADFPVTLFDNQYVLHAAFLYKYGVHDSDIGHYTVAIKLNEKWEIYDDYATKPKEVSNQHESIIHALFYVKRENEKEKQNLDHNTPLHKQTNKRSSTNPGKKQNTANKRSSSERMHSQAKRQKTTT